MQVRRKLDKFERIVMEIVENSKHDIEGVPGLTFKRFLFRRKKPQEEEKKKIQPQITIENIVILTIFENVLGFGQKP